MQTQIPACGILHTLTLALSLVSTPAWAQVVLPRGYSELTESPSNGNKIMPIRRDLDGDGRQDLAMLVHNPTAFSKYRLVMYLTRPGKQFEFDLINLNEGAIFPAPLAISNDVVTVGYSEDGTAAFERVLRFRYHPGKKQMQLIGYEVSYKASLAVHIDKSYNLLTGKYRVIQTTYTATGGHTRKHLDGRNGGVGERLFLGDISREVLARLDDVGGQYH